MKQLKYISQTLVILIEIGILLMVWANLWVYIITNGRTFTQISKVPPRECALVLGTSPKMKSGRANPYFISRMRAVATLFHHGKIKKIIVSGEKSPNYDEPKAMKKFLVYREGVPKTLL